jgi:tetratricopeptide (TPR) repeat protein
MAETALEEVSPKIMAIFNKGFSAFERGALEIAADLFFQCIEGDPTFLKARKFLRAAEIKLSAQKKMGQMSHHLMLLKNMPAYINGKMLLKKGKGGGALIVAEKLMKQDALNLQFIEFLVEAAEGANMPEVAIQTLDLVKDQYPENIQLGRMLGEAYQKAGKNKLAREIFEKLAQVAPNDPSVISDLKNAMALDSMNRDGWQGAQEKGGNYRELIKDAKEATLLEQEAKSVKTEKDVDNLVVDALAKIKAEPKNMNYYRSLARLYTQNKKFDDAIAILTTALEMAPGDPEIDTALSVARGQKFDHEIATLRAAGSNESADAKELEKLQFVFDDLQARVARYPHDPKLRYEWGVMLYENEYVNESIEQFQVSQKNPRYRTGSFYYLGLAFKQKNQYDLAKEQLEKTLPDLPTMDNMKKHVLYELGEVLELMGQQEKALDSYKQIYQADINFRDVAQKIENAYKK